MKKIAISLIVIMMISVGFLNGCNEQTGNIINSPTVDIISKSTRTGNEGLDYVVYVDVTVYNKGGDGAVTVWTKITQGDNEWTQKQAIYIKNEETRDLTFTFREVTFWSLESGIYSIWIENN